jgi:hypothetical protein
MKVKFDSSAGSRWAGVGLPQFKILTYFWAFPTLPVAVGKKRKGNGMRDPFFLIMVFALSALAAGWLYPGDKTTDLVSTAVAGGEAGVLAETSKTATGARATPASGVITPKGFYGGLGVFGAGQGVKAHPDVGAADPVLAFGDDSNVTGREAVTRSGPNETPADGMVQPVKMTTSLDRLDERQDITPPEGPVEESAMLKVQDSTDL